MATVDPTVVLQSIRRERANQEWISKSMAELRQKFGDRYVAVKDRQVVDHDTSFERLLAKVRKLPDPETVTIEYVTAQEYIWVL